MVVPEERSSTSKFGSDLELNSIVEWLSSVKWSSLVDVPGLTELIVAVGVSNPSPVSVNVSIHHQAFHSVVSNVSSRSAVPSGLNSVIITSEGSDDSNTVDLELNSSLISENVVSSQEWSNGFSSRVEDPPLPLVSWIMSLDSNSVLMSSNVFPPEESLVSVHS